MNAQEYSRTEKALNERHGKELFALAKEYALSKANYKVGDLVTDGRSTIKIEACKISVMFASHPYCVWVGPEYTKALQPRKDGAKAQIRDSEITELLK